jgi:hypothetical protein
MRDRKIIMDSAIANGHFQTSSGNLAILEVLLDIRELLMNPPAPPMSPGIVKRGGTS